MTSTPASLADYVFVDGLNAILPKVCVRPTAASHPVTPLEARAVLARDISDCWLDHDLRQLLAAHAKSDAQVTPEPPPPTRKVPHNILCGWIAEAKKDAQESLSAAKLALEFANLCDYSPAGGTAAQDARAAAENFAAAARLFSEELVFHLETLHAEDK